MLAIILLSLVGGGACVPLDYQLEYVTFVHRHGDRSPVGTYPTDPYSNESLWNNGWGELTNGGKQNAYNLGKWLRERYADFLPDIYNGKDYEVRSTDVSRTLMSAYLVLAGLYGPKGSDVWNPDIRWQPIPVHTTPKDLDAVLAAGKPCPRHTKLLLQLMVSKELSAQLAPHAVALSKVVENAGYESSNLFSNFITAAMVFDSLYVQKHNGYVLPEWTNPYFPQPLQNMSSLFLRLSTYNRPMQRLNCGLLVREILEQMKSKSLGMSRKKMWQYSAHDTTIVGLRQCLNLNETDSPTFASALILELFSKNDKYFVKILYKRGQELRRIVMPGCTEYCPLEKFEELVSPIIPEDWEAECKV